MYVHWLIIGNFGHVYIFENFLMQMKKDKVNIH